jgi:hypothetical protein
MVLSITRTPIVMPYIASKLKLTQMLAAMARMEMMADLYPNTRPKLTLVGNMHC